MRAPPPSRGRRAAVLALLPSAGGASGCAWIDGQQRRLALRPTPGRPPGLADDAQLFRPGDRRYRVPVAGGDGAAPEQLAVWWLPHADPRAPALLYLHGTFRNLYQNLSKIDALRAIGFSVLAVDYRGWGDSTPIVPDEDTIAADARTAFAELRRFERDGARRVIFGHSMGGAVAVRLAATLRGAVPPAVAPVPATAGPDYAALVLESTFTRLPDVAAEAGWLGRVAARLTSLRFDSRARIARVDAPILMLHGDADRTVPVALGRRLRDAARTGAVRWVEFAGGSHSRLHRDAPARYRASFEDFMRPLNLPLGAAAPTALPTAAALSAPPP